MKTTSKKSCPVSRHSCFSFLVCTRTIAPHGRFQYRLLNRPHTHPSARPPTHAPPHPPTHPPTHASSYGNRPNFSLPKSPVLNPAPARVSRGTMPLATPTTSFHSPLQRNKYVKNFSMASFLVPSSHETLVKRISLVYGAAIVESVPPNHPSTHPPTHPLTHSPTHPPTALPTHPLARPPPTHIICVCVVVVLDVQTGKPRVHTGCLRPRVCSARLGKTGGKARRVSCERKCTTQGLRRASRRLYC